jgi:acylphosphatase
MIARQVFYEGRVQGVGFRYSVRQVATGFDLSGWVRNLPDGRVELLAAGDEAEVADFLKAIEESSLASFIRNQTVNIIPPPPGLRGFEIVQ